MRILVACEFSGVLRDAFQARGHDVWSCDLVPTESKGPHIVNDCRNVLLENWDLMVAFPPCTYLCRSGARYWKTRQFEQKQALNLVRALMEAPIPRIAIENPIGLISTRIRKPDQIIQPWQFGHKVSKATCLWLKGLPLLFPNGIQADRLTVIHNMPPGPERSRNRSRTFTGIAQAMAEQWSPLLH